MLLKMSYTDNRTTIILLIVKKHNEPTTGKEQNFYENYDHARTYRRL